MTQTNMRKRTRWNAHQVSLAMSLATRFERCIANRDWCIRHHLPGEGNRWHDNASEILFSLDDLGLPDEVIQSLIGLNHSFEEFGLMKAKQEGE